MAIDYPFSEHKGPSATIPHSHSTYPGSSYGFQQSNRIMSGENPLVARRAKTRVAQLAVYFSLSLFQTRRPMSRRSPWTTGRSCFSWGGLNPTLTIHSVWRAVIMRFELRFLHHLSPVFEEDVKACKRGGSRVVHHVKHLQYTAGEWGESQVFFHWFHIKNRHIYWIRIWIINQWISQWSWAVVYETGKEDKRKREIYPRTVLQCFSRSSASLQNTGFKFKFLGSVQDTHVWCRQLWRIVLWTLIVWRQSDLSSNDILDSKEQAAIESSVKKIAFI